MPPWKTIAIAVGTAALVLGIAALVVWQTVARDRLAPATATGTPRPTVTAALTLTITPSSTATAAESTLGIVREYSPGALIIVITPIQGNTEQIIVPENIEVLWKDGRRASPSEISRGQTIRAEGTLDSLGRLVARVITIVDPGPTPTATPAVSPTPQETPTLSIPQSGWLGEYYANMNLSGSPVLVRQDPQIDFQWGQSSPDAAVPADRFSVRWRGYWPFEAGRYTFVALSDDGVRLWVDGQGIIDRWIDQAPAISSGEVYLMAGLHLIEVEYYDNREGAQIRVYWEKQSTFANWKGEYFDNPRLEGEPVLVRNDEDIRFNWGTSAPSPQLPADNFSVRWAQTFSLPEGAYRLQAKADDGVRVWVNDRLIIDAWLPSVGETFVGYVWLPSGNHTVRVEYLEMGGNASIQVWREEITTFSGWRGEYYANPDLADNPLFVRDDPDVSADWGDGSPGFGVPADGFSVRWTRRVQLEAGRHNFWAKADDGVRVYVDGRLLIDAWHGPSAQRVDGSIDLDAGEHRIVVEYYEGHGQAMIQFGWERSVPPTTTPTATTTVPAPTLTLTPTATQTSLPTETPTATATETAEAPTY